MGMSELSIPSHISPCGTSKQRLHTLLPIKYPKKVQVVESESAPTMRPNPRRHCHMEDPR